MLRKLMLLLLLLSLAPVSAGAEELPGALVPASLTQRADAQDLKIVLAAAEDTERAAQERTGQKEAKERPGCTFGEFFDIHFGGYRWLWWAGATAALVAIHAL